MIAEEIERLEAAWDMNVYADNGEFCEKRTLRSLINEIESDYSRDEIYDVVRALDSGRGVEVGEYSLWKVTK